MVQRTNQRERVYRELRGMLLNGSLQPGARLSETAWAERLEVHRGALREAFVLLAHEGLLTAGARGGYFVPVLERADLDEVLELRLALELGAIRRLARSSEPVQCTTLRATCAAMRQMAELDMLLGLAEADRKFHQGLVELAGNERMIRAYHQAPLLIFVSGHLASAEWRAATANTLREHEQICDLLEAEQFHEAAEALEQHLYSNAVTLVSLHRGLTVE